eukprot:TRINITY_DN113565_c0_g1_i1.p1 TRINITY_DN113565_c0_g1~~TRINITY_DN113565_c0_g1_i1.p1  ORF type:complete len:449 (-),score=49.48 TRINITY_DN113565_c0_g1_i1:221-1525(-)
MAATWTEQHLTSEAPPLARHACLPRLLGQRGWRTIAVLNEEGMPDLAKDQHGFQEVVMDPHPERVLEKLTKALSEGSSDVEGVFIYFYFSHSHEGHFSLERWQDTPHLRAFGMGPNLHPFVEPLEGERNVYLNLLRLGDLTAAGFAKTLDKFGQTWKEQKQADPAGDVRIWFSDHGVTFPSDEGVEVGRRDVRHGATASRVEAQQILAIQGIPSNVLISKRVEGLTRMADVFETLGDLLGFRGEGQLYVGRSLILSQPLPGNVSDSPSASTRQLSTSRPLHGTHSFWDNDAFAVRTRRFAVVSSAGGEFRAFDRRVDPWEEHPLELKSLSPKDVGDIYWLLREGRIEKEMSSKVYGAIEAWLRAHCAVWRRGHRWCNMTSDRHEDIQYRDKDSRCDDWAKNGECKLNPQFMYPNCPVSCNLVSNMTDMFLEARH